MKLLEKYFNDTNGEAVPCPKLYNTQSGYIISAIVFIGYNMSVSKYDGSIIKILLPN